MEMLIQFPILLVAGLIAGAVNSIAGGGSFLLYPLLLGLGIPPINANATCSLGVLPGNVSSAYGYRSYIKKLPIRYYFLLIPVIFGALSGAILLERTPNSTFEFIVPWFILAAAVLLMIQPIIHRWLYQKENKRRVDHHKLIVLWLVGMALFVLAIYGGYFGAGYGIMMLAFLGFTELTNIHQMNGLKNLTGILLTGVSSAYFIMHGLINWKVIPALMIGNAIGGFLGAKYSGKLGSKLIRGIIIGIALTLAIVLFGRAYF